MNAIEASNKEFRKLKTRYIDLKRAVQFVSCSFFVSGDAVPLVQGKIFSSCLSLKNNGTNIIIPIIAASVSIETVKLYSFDNQVPKASVVEIATILEPHIKPFARACWSTGIR